MLSSKEIINRSLGLSNAIEWFREHTIKGTNKMKVLYYSDPYGNRKDEIATINLVLKRYDLRAEVTEDPWNEIFDMLIFDYGGALPFEDESTIQHVLHNFFRHAEEHPSREYLIRSDFIMWAVADFKREHPEAANLANVHFAAGSAMRDVLYLLTNREAINE